MVLRIQKGISKRGVWRPKIEAGIRFLERGGETVWNTIKMAEQYSDVLVIRSLVEGPARLAAETASHPRY